MGGTIPASGRLRGEVISSERSAYDARRGANRGDAVKANVARFKYNASIERWRKRFVTSGYVVVPKLEVPAPRLFPQLIKINKNIQPAV